jgi:hypothetical protein
MARSSTWCRTDADKRRRQHENGPWKLTPVSEYIMNDGELTLIMKAETAPRDACGITVDRPARAA